MVVRRAAQTADFRPANVLNAAGRAGPITSRQTPEAPEWFLRSARLERRFAACCAPWPQRGGGAPSGSTATAPSPAPAVPSFPGSAAVSSLCCSTAFRHFLPPIPVCIGFRMRPP